MCDGAETDDELDGDLHTRLLAAIYTDNLRDCKRLCREGARVDGVIGDNRVPLLEASAADRATIVKVLVQAGAMLERCNMDGMSAIHFAAQSGSTKAAHTLVDCGAEVDARTHHNETALHMASAEGHPATVELLLSLGADDALCSVDGWSCLHWAVSGGHIAVAKVLLEAGAVLDQTNQLGQTPLIVAAMCGELGSLQLLLEHGAMVDVVTTAKTTALDAVILLDPRSHPDSANMLRLLLRFKAEVSLPMLIAAVGSRELVGEQPAQELIHSYVASGNLVDKAVLEFIHRHFPTHLPIFDACVQHALSPFWMCLVVCTVLEEYGASAAASEDTRHKLRPVIDLYVHRACQFADLLHPNAAHQTAYEWRPDGGEPVAGRASSAAERQRQQAGGRPRVARAKCLLWDRSSLGAILEPPPGGPCALSALSPLQIAERFTYREVFNCLVVREHLDNKWTGGRVDAARLQGLTEEVLERCSLRQPRTEWPLTYILCGAMVKLFMCTLAVDDSPVTVTLKRHKWCPPAMRRVFSNQMPRARAFSRMPYVRFASHSLPKIAAAVLFTFGGTTACDPAVVHCGHANRTAQHAGEYYYSAVGGAGVEGGIGLDYVPAKRRESLLFRSEFSQPLRAAELVFAVYIAGLLVAQAQELARDGTRALPGGRKGSLANFASACCFVPAISIRLAR